MLVRSFANWPAQAMKNGQSFAFGAQILARIRARGRDLSVRV
jgi:hypothetical protein